MEDLRWKQRRRGELAVVAVRSFDAGVNIPKRTESNSCELIAHGREPPRDRMDHRTRSSQPKPARSSSLNISFRNRYA